MPSPRGTLPELHASQPRLDALTPLRFVAAALIVAGHGGPLFGFVPDTTRLYTANASVSLFFVMSGFVLAYNYPALDSQEAVGRFCVLRFARIWPLHAAILSATILFLPATLPAGIDPLVAAMLAFLLVQSWVPINGYAAAWNGPAWTLSVDVFFYAVFPMILAPLRRAPWRSLAVALALSLVPPLLANRLGGPRADLPLDQWNWYMLDHFFPLARLCEFVLGMVAARGFAAWRRPLTRGAHAATAIEVGALAACAAAVVALPQVPYAARYVGPGVADWLTQIAAAPAFAALIVALAPGRGALSRLLATRPAVHLGDLSYATYLLHVPLLHLPAWGAMVAAAGGTAAAAAFAATLLVAAHLAWRFVEGPARRALVGAYDRRARGRAGVAVQSEPTS